MYIWTPNSNVYKAKSKRLLQKQSNRKCPRVYPERTRGDMNDIVGAATNFVGCLTGETKADYEAQIAGLKETISSLEEEKETLKEKRIKVVLGHKRDVDAFDDLKIIHERQLTELRKENSELQTNLTTEKKINKNLREKNDKRYQKQQVEHTESISAQNSAYAEQFKRLENEKVKLEGTIALHLQDAKQFEGTIAILGEQISSLETANTELKGKNEAHIAVNAHLLEINVEHYAKADATLQKTKAYYEAEIERLKETNTVCEERSESLQKKMEKLIREKEAEERNTEAENALKSREGQLAELESVKIHIRRIYGTFWTIGDDPDSLFRYWGGLGSASDVWRDAIVGDDHVNGFSSHLLALLPVEKCGDVAKLLLAMVYTFQTKCKRDPVVVDERSDREIAVNCVAMEDAFNKMNLDPRRRQTAPGLAFIQDLYGGEVSHRAPSLYAYTDEHILDIFWRALRFPWGDEALRILIAAKHIWLAFKANSTPAPAPAPEPEAAPAPEPEAAPAPEPEAAPAPAPAPIEPPNSGSVNISSYISSLNEHLNQVYTLVRVSSSGTDATAFASLTRVIASTREIKQKIDKDLKTESFGKQRDTPIIEWMLKIVDALPPQESDSQDSSAPAEEGQAGALAEEEQAGALANKRTALLDYGSILRAAEEAVAAANPAAVAAAEAEKFEGLLLNLFEGMCESVFDFVTKPDESLFGYKYKASAQKLCADLEKCDNQFYIITSACLPGLALAEEVDRYERMIVTGKIDDISFLTIVVRQMWMEIQILKPKTVAKVEDMRQVYLCACMRLHSFMMEKLDEIRKVISKKKKELDGENNTSKPTEKTAALEFLDFKSLGSADLESLGSADLESLESAVTYLESLTSFKIFIEILKTGYPKIARSGYPDGPLRPGRCAPLNPGGVPGHVKGGPKKREGAVLDFSRANKVESDTFEGKTAELLKKTATLLKPMTKNKTQNRTEGKKSLPKNQSIISDVMGVIASLSIENDDKLLKMYHNMGKNAVSAHTLFRKCIVSWELTWTLSTRDFDEQQAQILIAVEIPRIQKRIQEICWSWIQEVVAEELNAGSIDTLPEEVPQLPKWSTWFFRCNELAKKKNENIISSKPSSATFKTYQDHLMRLLALVASKEKIKLMNLRDPLLRAIVQTFSDISDSFAEFGKTKLRRDDITRFKGSILQIKKEVDFSLETEQMKEDADFADAVRKSYEGCYLNLLSTLHEMAANLNK